MKEEPYLKSFFFEAWKENYILKLWSAWKINTTDTIIKIMYKLNCEEKLLNISWELKGSGGLLQICVYSF